MLGSINGQFGPALKKITSLHSKNSFSLAILTGDVFSHDTDDAIISSLLNGEFEFPLPTYFTMGNHALPDRIAAKIEADEEICHNLHFLGKRSITKTADGLRIVALGGLLDPNLVGGQSKEQHLPFHTADDAKSLKGANSADILLTSMWPAGVWEGAKATLDDDSQQASLALSEQVAELCATLKPRYHLTASSGPFFYERDPFMHPAEKDTDLPTVTRFISMAPFGNEAKAKAMYAFTLNKSDDTIPPGTTPSPFVSREKKRPRNNNDDSSSYNRFESHNDNSHRHGRKKKRRNQSPPPGPERCYFCLSNPNISDHMCCSIGDDAYITTAKGPLPKPDTFAAQGLNFPAHFIIIPLPHNPTIQSLGSTTDLESEAVKTYKEMERFRQALQSMIAAKSSYELGAVTWEISRENNIHIIWQTIAVPVDLVEKGLAETGFQMEAENKKYPNFIKKDLAVNERPEFGDFFRVCLWADNGDDKITDKSIIMPLPSDMRFDAQFGRRVMGKLLGLNDRFVWQNCEQTVQEETADVDAFKEAFKEWDFTV